MGLSEYRKVPGLSSATMVAVLLNSSVALRDVCRQDDAALAALSNHVVIST